MRVVLVITAVLVWVNVSALLNQTKTWSAPIMMTGLSEGLAVANAITVARAEVTGRPAAIAKLSADSFVFGLDLSGITTPGRYSRPVNLRQAPAGVQVSRYHPTEMVVDIEVETSKLVPVVLTTTGWVADGYSVKSTQLTPDHITVYGAPSMLERVTHAAAEVALNHRRESFTTPVSFTVVDGTRLVVGSVRPAPAEGKATITVGTGAAFRNLGLKSAFTGELPGGFWVQEVKFEPAVVLVSGTQQILDQLAYLTATPINLTSRTKSFTDQVAVELPAGVSLVGDNLILASVTIGSAQGTRQFNLVPQYANITEGFSVTAASPGSVAVVITGEASALNALKRTDIILRLDLQGALSGANMITLTRGMFTVPTGVEIVSFAPERVEVVLSRVQ